MKAAIAALILIASIITATAWNARITQNRIAELMSATSVAQLHSAWIEYLPHLRLTVNRKYLHNVNSALIQLKAYADRQDSTEFIAARSALELALENIKTLESLSGAP